jgi:PHP family Zn ribbon phosphoesterase
MSDDQIAEYVRCVCGNYDKGHCRQCGAKLEVRPADCVRWEVLMYGLKLGNQKQVNELVDLLKQGWEPFAVTRDGHVYDYHLRRQSDGEA